MIEELVEMRKTDFYIRLESEQDFPIVFSDFYRQDYVPEYDEETETIIDVPTGDPYLVAHTSDYAIDIIDAVYKYTGVILIDSDGEEYDEQIRMDGYHVNVRLVGDNFRQIVEQIDAVYGVEPVTPNRIWL